MICVQERGQGHRFIVDSPVDLDIFHSVLRLCHGRHFSHQSGFDMSSLKEKAQEKANSHDRAVQAKRNGSEIEKS